MKKIAVILSGCGVFDGAEIHEAVLTLHAIEKEGATWHCFAPNIDQLHVVNHFTGEVTEESRNVLVESARIARGNVQDVKQLVAQDFDALIVPGGFGAAKNLTTFAVAQADCQINEDVKTACLSFAQANKPAGYMCIAPVIIPMVYASQAKGTIGNDEGTAGAFQQLGGAHQECPVNDIVIDDKHNIVSTPAYMLAGSISEANSGIEHLVKEIIARA